MIFRAVVCSLFAFNLLSAGCQTDARHGTGGRTGANDGPLHQGYALLYSTLKDEAQVDKSLILKDPGDEVEQLIKSISHFCGEAKTRLDTIAHEDDGLNWSDDGLPEVEIAARKSISASTGKQILLSGGEEFAFTILLTQHEALKYIVALARELAEREGNDSHKRFLIRVAEDAEVLHQLVIDRLKTPFVQASKR